MKNIKFSAALAVAVGICSWAVCAPAYSWDGIGHQIVTQVAYDNLKPNVKTQVDVLIAAMNNDPDVVGLDADVKPYNFVTAGDWMDDLRSFDRQFNTWHYSDLPLDDDSLTADGVAKFMDTNPNNNVHAIETFCLPTLKNPSAPLADRARALGFFLHLAGDIHQPLHSVGIDKGGNSYMIDPVPSSDPDYPVKNLHSFWDGAYRYTGKGGQVTLAVPTSDQPRITAPGQDPIRSLATMVETDFAPRAPNAASDENPADWALESRNIAASFTYPAMDNQHVLTPEYVQVAHDLACQRLELAGLRIATVLNDIFGGGTPRTSTSTTNTPMALTVLNLADTDNTEKAHADQSSVAAQVSLNSVSGSSSDVANALKPSDTAKALAVSGNISLVGTITNAYSPESHSIVILDFSADYQHAITAIVRPDSYSKLPDLKTLEGKKVLVTGPVSNYDGRAQITITDPSQIQLVK